MTKSILDLGKDKWAINWVYCKLQKRGNKPKCFGHFKIILKYDLKIFLNWKNAH